MRCLGLCYQSLAMVGDSHALKRQMSAVLIAQPEKDISEPGRCTPRFLFVYLFLRYNLMVAGLDPGSVLTLPS